MIRYIVLVSLLAGMGCASVESRDERAEIRRAWALMESGNFDASIEAVRPFLETKDPEVALAIAHIFNERAIQEEEYAIDLRKRDRLCFIQMLERSALLGDLGAASTLSATLSLNRLYIEKDSFRAKCWGEVAESGRDSRDCIRVSADACK